MHVYSNLSTPLQARSTPKNCGPPRPPVKSAPPVSRIFPHRPIERAQVVSFRSDEGSRCILYLYEQKLGYYVINESYFVYLFSLLMSRTHPKLQSVQ